jgi:hypothetical protein
MEENLDDIEEDEDQRELDKLATKSQAAKRNMGAYTGGDAGYYD